MGICKHATTLARLVGDKDERAALLGSLSNHRQRRWPVFERDHVLSVFGQFDTRFSPIYLFRLVRDNHLFPILVTRDDNLVVICCTSRSQNWIFLPLRLADYIHDGFARIHIWRFASLGNITPCIYLLSQNVNTTYPEQKRSDSTD